MENIEYTGNEINKENLLKLADFLEKEVEGKREFDMFELNENGNIYSDYPKEICGTVACALGYAPLAFELKDEDYRDDGQFCYKHFCKRVFNIKWADDERLWAWCFSPAWADFDNSAKGAALRIRYLVNNKIVPSFRFDYDENYDFTKYVSLYQEAV